MSLWFENGFAIKKMRIYTTEPGAIISIWSVENSAAVCQKWSELEVCKDATLGVKRIEFTQTNDYWYDLDLSGNNGFYWAKDYNNRYMIETKDASGN